LGTRAASLPLKSTGSKITWVVPIYRGLDETNIATQVEREDAALVRGFKTEDYREGATAWWINKRKPKFVGR